MCQVTTEHLLCIQRLLDEQDVPQDDRVVAWVGVDGSCYISPMGVVWEEDDPHLLQ